MVAAGGCGGGSPARPRPGATASSARTADAHALALGFTEPNPHLYAPGVEPPTFGVVRDAVSALRPRYVRVLIEWSHVQPRPDRAPDWAAPQDGCDRGISPCRPYAGVRARLLAAKASGLEVMVTFLFPPPWAAAAPAGCERAHTAPYQRAPGALTAYRALVRSLLAEVRRDGVDVRWWSAWNEPNHPGFLNPQRATCDRASPVLSPGRYTELVRAMRAELATAPGEHRIVLGDLSGYARSSANFTGVGEFVRALPRDVVCTADVWAQHVYVERHGELSGNTEGMPPGSEPLLREVESALDAHGCAGPPPPIWITETGANPATGADGCHAMAQALAAWSADSRVRAAFQYTVRDDPVIRSGLTDPRLTGLHAVYAAWRAAADGRPGGGC